MARIEAVVPPPPPQPLRAPRPARWSPASSRSAPTSSRPSSAASSLDLTRREFELLQLLAEAKGQVLERETIYQRVWGYAMAHGDRSVDVFVRKLRQKLEKRSPSWSYIHTHFGVGYRFDPEPVTPGTVEEPPEAADSRRAEAADRSPRRSRPHFTSRSQAVHSEITGRPRPAILGANGGGNRTPRHGSRAGWRSGLSSTRLWSTAAP